MQKFSFFLFSSIAQFGKLSDFSVSQASKVKRKWKNTESNHQLTSDALECPLPKKRYKATDSDPEPAGQISASNEKERDGKGIILPILSTTNVYKFSQFKISPFPSRIRYSGAFLVLRETRHKVMVTFRFDNLANFRIIFEFSIEDSNFIEHRDASTQTCPQYIEFKAFIYGNEMTFQAHSTINK